MQFHDSSNKDCAHDANVSLAEEQGNEQTNDCDDFEDVLLVPPKLVQSIYEDLANARLVSRRWHQDGRYGGRIRADGGRRAIPVLHEATRRLCAPGGAMRLEGSDVANESSDSEKNLLKLLLSGEIQFASIARMVPKNVPRPEATDHSVQPSALAQTIAVAGLPHGSFTFVELFAGIGGFRLGLEAIGGQCVFASEIHPATSAVYTQNCSGNAKLFGDITAIPDSSIPPHDLLVGGFPCQPFSALGLQPGLDDGKGVLFQEIVRVLTVQRPRAFLLENVPGLLQCDEGRAFRTIVSALEETGYDVTWQCINARCLTAQSRNRIYIVGLRRCSLGNGETFEFPYIPDLGLRAGDCLELERDLVATGLADECTLSNEQELKLRGSELWKQRGGMTSCLAWEDKTCNTIVAHYANTLIHGTYQLVPRAAPCNPRLFTPRECARLMGFPDSFTLLERKADADPRKWNRSMYTMFGNAVCPPIIAALGGAILARCSDLPGFNAVEDWTSLGRSQAVRLALDAVAPHRIVSVFARRPSHLFPESSWPLPQQS